MARILLLFSILLVTVSACNNKQVTEEKDLLAKVGSLKLYRPEVASAIPHGITPADSLLFAESYVHRWVTDALIYQAAEKNLDKEKEEIDQLVNDYKHSLMRHKYQEKMVRERLSANIGEEEKQAYYKVNHDKFILENNLIKGLFLKIPVDAPGLSDIKKWYKIQNSASLEKIEKYSVQNAIIYDYFYDRWIDFDKVMDNIPVYLTDPVQFLKSNKQVEKTDSSYCYLLNISDYLLKGNIAPYEYVGPQIQEMLINQRKVDFIKTFEENLYKDGVRKGEAVFYDEKSR